VTHQDLVEATSSTAEDSTSNAKVVLRLDGVDKWYTAVHALKGVSLDVRAGEIHALVGENGAG
jgi:ABC-type sugar transport system ATPase subunit